MTFVPPRVYLPQISVGHPSMAYEQQPVLPESSLKPSVLSSAAPHGLIWYLVAAPLRMAYSVACVSQKPQQDHGAQPCDHVRCRPRWGTVCRNKCTSCPVSAPNSVQSASNTCSDRGLYVFLCKCRTCSPWKERHHVPHDPCDPAVGLWHSRRAVASTLTPLAADR